MFTFMKLKCPTDVWLQTFFIIFFLLFHITKKIDGENNLRASKSLRNNPIIPK